MATAVIAAALEVGRVNVENIALLVGTGIEHDEIGIPNERAARLMLSNWATLTNIRMSSRFAMEVTLPFLEIRFQSFPSNQSAAHGP